jgi:hypothetical protein
MKNSQAELKKVVKEKQVILALKANAKQGLVDARAKLEEKKSLDASTNKYAQIFEGEGREGHG